MHVAKIISGLGCIFCCIVVRIFRADLWRTRKYLSSKHSCCLRCVFGQYRMSSCCETAFSIFSKTAKVLIFLVLAVVIVSPIILDVHIRQERAALQMRAKEFLLRPIPKLLIPNSEGEVGGYYVDTNAGIANGVFGYSRILIERYATKGRIRWSAAIQGQFACTGDNCLNGNISADVLTNEEVRRYSAESHAILAQEWRMGYWQWVEDTMEFKSVIPEIEEEDQI